MSQFFFVTIIFMNSINQDYSFSQMNTDFVQVNIDFVQVNIDGFDPEKFRVANQQAMSCSLYISIFKNKYVNNVPTRRLASREVQRMIPT